jgi:hypothetical protein
MNRTTGHLGKKWDFFSVVGGQFNPSVNLSPPLTTEHRCFLLHKQILLLMPIFDRGKNAAMAFANKKLKIFRSDKFLTIPDRFICHKWCGLF